jgi:hypothetical protein
MEFQMSDLDQSFFTEQDTASMWEQLSQEEEMHFCMCVNDVKDAFQYHGIPAILDEVMKDPKLRNQFVAYLTNTLKNVMMVSKQ